MIWTILVLAHLAGFVSYTLLLRKSALSVINKYLLAAVSQTAIFIPALFFLITGRLTFVHTGTEWLYLLASGFTLTVLHLLMVLALKNLEASVWTLIFNLRLLLTTIFGLIFLQELPSSLQLAGGVIIFGSVIVLNLHKNKRYAEKPIMIGLLTTLWFSVHATLEKYNVIHIGFEDYMFFAGLLSIIGLWAIAYSRNVRLGSLRRSIDATTLKMLIMRTISAWTYVYALRFGSLAATNYVSGMGVVLIVAFGVFWLGERSYLRQKITATAISVVGLTLILTSKL